MGDKHEPSLVGGTVGGGTRGGIPRAVRTVTDQRGSQATTLTDPYPYGHTVAYRDAFGVTFAFRVRYATSTNWMCSDIESELVADDTGPERD